MGGAPNRNMMVPTMKGIPTTWDIKTRKNVKWMAQLGSQSYGNPVSRSRTGTWHMTVIRDTDFTPSHIIEFYMSYPIYSVIAVGAFFYAKTRIPFFAHRLLASVPDRGDCVRS